MATVTWSYDNMTGVAIIDSPITQYITGSTFVPTIPAHYVRGNSGYVSANASRYYMIQYGFYNGSSRIGYTGDRTALVTNTVANSSTNATVPATTAVSQLATSSYFNSSNSTTRVVPISIRHETGGIVSGGTQYMWDSSDSSSTAVVIGTINLTLNAPPTFNVGSMTFDTSYIYTGLTTASVSVSSLSAKYGGSISEVKLTIGNQSVTRTNAGTLSILLENVGTFTPTVTVTDSRGQTTTKTLESITVNGYVAPTVSFTAERTNSNGIPNDEGTSATLVATFNFTDVVATLSAPTVAVDGNTTSTTWYTTRASSGAVSGAVNWSTLTSPVTLYGVVSGSFSTQSSYQISVMPVDSKSTGASITQTLATAFYTIDFLAGGHGIAFGQPASQDGFECNMVTTFHEPVTAENDIYITIEENATSGTTDGDLYDALVTLGWI